ncbi:Chromate resistance protein ChrB [Dictyobacter kobayashii]|uniref:ChrB N-terminal domain-containing protein n=1 Tax=Dictyobacter kobayashii TaxID=2014872 RepID=A0A402ABU4_9CHLR|nr:Chromate resistance protein ChrB [Dictyobacter kobayashii]GCE16567.1 hypothetical protein KDK_03670 [Dictyobacter kobayashii]
MQEHGVMRWLQLTYKVPSEPSQKRVWVWRRLQNLGAYALQNSVYLLPYSEEVEKHFRQLSHDIHEMGGEASIFSVVALDVADEQRILHALLDCRNADYNKAVKVCARFLSRAVDLVEKQEWNEQLQAEFSDILEKVHLSFRSARRHDVLGSYTAIARASAAEAIAVCEQVFRVLQVREFAKARRLLEMNYEWIYLPTAAEQETSPCSGSQSRQTASLSLPHHPKYKNVSDPYDCTTQDEM